MYVSVLGMENRTVVSPEAIPRELPDTHRHTSQSPSSLQIYHWPLAARYTSSGTLFPGFEPTVRPWRTVHSCQSFPRNSRFYKLTNRFSTWSVSNRSTVKFFIKLNKYDMLISSASIHPSLSITRNQLTPVAKFMIFPLLS